MNQSGTLGIYPLRSVNDVLVFETLCEAGPLSRASIARRTGLSKPTVLDVTERLLSSRLIEASGHEAAKRPGPKASLYRIPEDLGFGAGIELLGHSVAVRVQNLAGQTLAEEHLAVQDRESGIQDLVTGLIRACQGAGISTGQLSATVLGTAGGVDPLTGEIYASSLPHWQADLSQELAPLLGGPLSLDNETNLRAVAEHRIGTARGLDDFALVMLDSGIGVGIIIDGALYRGARGMSGELGYLPRGLSGNPRAPLLSMRDQLNDRSILAAADEHGVPGETAEHVIQIACQDEVLYGAFLDQLTETIAFGLAALLVVLNPQCIVISGKYSHAGGEKLRRRLAESLSRVFPDVKTPEVHVRLSELTGSPVLTGAMCLVQRQLRDAALAGSSECPPTLTTRGAAPPRRSARLLESTPKTVEARTPRIAKTKNGNP